MSYNYEDAERAHEGDPGASPIDIHVLLYEQYICILTYAMYLYTHLTYIYIYIYIYIYCSYLLI